VFLFGPILVDKTTAGGEAVSVGTDRTASDIAMFFEERFRYDVDHQHGAVQVFPRPPKVHEFHHTNDCHMLAEE